MKRTRKDIIRIIIEFIFLIGFFFLMIPAGLEIKHWIGPIILSVGMLGTLSVGILLGLELTLGPGDLDD